MSNGPWGISMKKLGGQMLGCRWTKLLPICPAVHILRHTQPGTNNTSTQHTAHNTSPRTASPHRQHTPSLVSSVQFHLSQHQKNWFQVISLLGKLSIFVKSREQNSKFLKVRQVGKIDWFNLIVQTSESSRRNGRSVAVGIFYFDLSR